MKNKCSLSKAQLRPTFGVSTSTERQGKDWLEYDSTINIRPSAGNRSRNVEGPDTRELIQDILSELITR